MSWLDLTLGYIIKALILPPGLNFFVIITGLVLRLRWQRLGTAVAAIGFVTLWLLSLPIVAGLSVASLDHSPAFDLTLPVSEEVIVILGGKSNSRSAEYGGATVGADTLERIRYGAMLARQLKLPIAVTGGPSSGSNAQPLGSLMARVLEQEFNEPVDWVETSSRNTAQNAINLRSMLPLDHIILVTHSIHMSRALTIFEKVGFTVRAAPIDIPAHSAGGFKFRLSDWLPSASALLISRTVLYEWLGSAYYSLRYQ